MNPTQAGRLAHAINDLRPDWPISSVRTFLERELMARPYRDVVVALTWVAVDLKPDGTPASATPKRVLEAGPWWRAASAGEPGVTAPRNPSADTACPVCSRLVGSCLCPPAVLEAQRHGPATAPTTYADQIRAAAGFRPKNREGSS